MLTPSSWTFRSIIPVLFFFMSTNIIAQYDNGGVENVQQRISLQGGLPYVDVSAALTGNLTGNWTRQLWFFDLTDPSFIPYERELH